MDKINLRPNHLFACSLLLAGCDSTLDDSGDDVDETVEPAPQAEIAGPDQPQVPVTAPIVDCPSARVIGILDGNPHGSCSLRNGLPPGWIWTAMFLDGSPGVDALTMPVPADLQRFCMFEYSSGKPGLEDYTQLFTAIDNYPYMELDSVATDCRGEFAQADLNDPSLGFELHDAFRTGIDWIDAAELGPSQAMRTRVDMTVVDTISQTAAAQNIQPENQHGLFMAKLIGDIACPDADPNCLENLRYTLAMPRHDWASGPDWIRGGAHGTQGDLALAVYEAVAGWHERRVNNPSKAAPRLVLNLSLGWQRLTQDANDPDRGPTKSLLSALQFASCQGALVFVAAGNNPDEGCPDDHVGPLAPAMFEAIPAPTEHECDELGFSSPWAAQFPVFAQNGGYAPLVHAVGGVDERDLPLINARAGGRPRLAALGSNGVFADAGGSTEPLTGSSVSAAVASGAAALLWSYQPELRPDEIVDILYQAGWDLGDPSDFGIGGGGDRIHRISVCGALAKACVGMDPAECPELKCEAHQPDTFVMDGFFAQVESLIEDPSTELDKIDTNQSPAAPVCEQFDWTELADPQPEKPICARCNMVVASGSTFGDDSVKMTTDAVYDGQVTAAWITVVDGAGMPAVINFDATVITSINSPTTDVTVAYVDAPATVSATLNFSLADGTTQANSISVKQL
ncbi:S8/S53 family peptidase [Nannocystaceae bacterium ST9]